MYESIKPHKQAHVPYAHNVQVEVLPVIATDSEVFIVYDEPKDNQQKSYTLPRSILMEDEGIHRAAKKALSGAGLNIRPDKPVEQLDAQKVENSNLSYLSIGYMALSNICHLQPVPDISERSHALIELRNQSHPEIPERVHELLSVAVGHMKQEFLLNNYKLLMQLAPKEFSLRQIQDIYESIMEKSVSRDVFRHQMFRTGMITSLGKKRHNVDYRPPELFRVN